MGRRGYARSTVEHLAVKTREAGANRVGLHALADNAGALALYAKLGFFPASQRMAMKI